ncbi:hypothetical protein [Fundidesulfovibrio soli]|uniref:hypothetical protein n=1 Tax=Fundidesulfovibrio soli TaxID=2922716 RepID=UPI001FAEA779|nr:hypothetical protein [Fundidesulfovibrio soli]
MSSDSRLHPLSLTGHFEAPEEYEGCFGWMCGFSADAKFLDAALERFSGLTSQRRELSGRVYLALMLDPRHPQISPTDAPGVLHLGYSGHRRFPFNLLHAKVALLGYRKAADPSAWKLRLLVSTGNWTVQTLEESIDLAWRTDLDAGDLPPERTARTRADIAAAWGMLSWLLGRYDARILDVPALEGRVSETRHAMSGCRDWVEAVVKSRCKGRPRFIDSRSKSLLVQVPELIQEICSPVARNYLAMGSGFFETDCREDALPSVLNGISKALKRDGLMSSSAQVDVFVNPGECQGVARAADAILKNKGWSLRKPSTPSCFGNSGRFLHAKFLFGANRRGGSNSCGSAWIYLGSGNLTRPGFAQPMSADGGNLEAGVVFAPDGLLWKREPSDGAALSIEDALPILPGEELSLKETPLGAGENLSPRDGFFAAPPVPWLRWTGSEGSGLLQGPEESAEYDVLTSTGEPCPREGANRHRWPSGVSPRQVHVRWASNGEIMQAMVPVLDEYGRVSPKELQRLDLRRAWWDLCEFPSAPQDDGPQHDPPEDEPPGNPVGDPPPPGDQPPVNDAHASRPAPEAGYPVREMMRLVEALADKQVRLNKSDWPIWCARLEQILTQAADSVELQYFKGLGLDPLSPLLHPAFRPQFAETGATGEGQLYEAALARLGKAWGVTNLEKIGRLP